MDTSIRAENELNKFLNKNFYVNSSGDVVIKGIMPRLVISKQEQSELLADIKNLINRKTVGDNITLLERFALNLILEGTY